MKIASSLEEQGNEYGFQTKTCGCYFYCSDNRLGARAEEAESKHKTLEESKKKLQDELKNFRATFVTLEKLASVEKHLRDSDLQLEHAVAAVEASKEKQNLLYSTVSDMEDVI